MSDSETSSTSILKPLNYADEDTDNDIDDEERPAKKSRKKNRVYTIHETFDTYKQALGTVLNLNIEANAKRRRLKRAKMTKNKIYLNPRLNKINTIFWGKGVTTGANRLNGLKKTYNVNEEKKLSILDQTILNF
ncbi:hypothetical protein BpHYR1_044686, partial [Brachionus plicatilis]